MPTVKLGIYIICFSPSIRQSTFSWRRPKEKFMPNNKVLMHRRQLKLIITSLSNPCMLTSSLTYTLAMTRDLRGRPLIALLLPCFMSLQFLFVDVHIKLQLPGFSLSNSVNRLSMLDESWTFWTAIPFQWQLISFPLHLLVLSFDKYRKTNTYYTLLEKLMTQW